MRLPLLYGYLLLPKMFYLIQICALEKTKEESVFFGNRGCQWVDNVQMWTGL